MSQLPQWTHRTNGRAVGGPQALFNALDGDHAHVMSTPPQFDDLRPHHITVGDDGTAASVAAADAAIELAGAWGASLSFIFVSGGAPAGPRGFAVSMAARCRALGVTYSVDERPGQTAVQLVAFAAEQKSGLIILGGRPSRNGEPPLGSVGRAVIACSSIPVLIARPMAWPPSYLVVGDDGSTDASRAGRLAALIGSTYGAHALLDDAMPLLAHVGADPSVERFARRLRTAEAARLADDVRELEPLLGEQPVSQLSFQTADIALRENAQTAAAHGNVLIAVGSSGKGEKSKLLGWSVSAAAVDMDFASVLVVPHRALVASAG